MCRRESCRDGGISRAPKVLSAARLLEDARDVAGIRADAGLRANYQGVCWIASNWCVGGTKGVLSGKRYLVLCDNIVWAELREVDRRSSVGEHEQGETAKILDGCIRTNGCTSRSTTEHFYCFRYGRLFWLFDFDRF